MAGFVANSIHRLIGWLAVVLSLILIWSVVSSYVDGSVLLPGRGTPRYVELADSFWAFWLVMSFYALSAIGIFWVAWSIILRPVWHLPIIKWLSVRAVTVIRRLPGSPCFGRRLEIMVTRFRRPFVFVVINKALVSARLFGTMKTVVFSNSDLLQPAELSLNIDAIRRCLAQALSQLSGNQWLRRKPLVMIHIPVNPERTFTTAEKNALSNAAIEAGAAIVMVSSQPLPISDAELSKYASVFR